MTNLARRATKYLNLVATLLVAWGVQSQNDGYRYMRPLTVSELGWYSIELDPSMIANMSQELQDVRIYGVTETGDTIEAPFVKRISSGSLERSAVAFQILNQSERNGRFYYTFELPQNEEINHIDLEFTPDNYDWRVSLEGSQDQNEWFTITKSYRILSIHNEHTNYSFSTLRFPNSDYRYYRLAVNSEQNPGLKTAQLFRYTEQAGNYVVADIAFTSIEVSKKERKTIVDVSLAAPTRINRIELVVADSFDFYRPVTISFLADSFKTDKGWQYTYQNIGRSTLSSIDEHGFMVESTTSDQIRIEISDGDNTPLKISSVRVLGYHHHLIARLTEHASYFIVYGNPNASQVRYDIEEFPKNIPDSPPVLKLGEVSEIAQTHGGSTRPLFENQAWLWVIMGIIILLIAWFTLKMIRS
jgi:hypothetical protein